MAWGEQGKSVMPSRKDALVGNCKVFTRSILL